MYILIYVPTASLQLLLYNGVSDKKGVLSDDHVLISAKCQVCFKWYALSSDMLAKCY